MVNVTVINKKDAIKYLAKIVIILILFGLVVKSFLKLKVKNISEITKKQDVSSKVFTYCLDDTIPNIQEVNNSNSLNNSKSDVEVLKLAINTELGVIDSMEKKIENVQKDEIIKEEASSISDDGKSDIGNIDNEVKKAEINVKTEIQSSNVPNKYTDVLNGVQVKNESEKTITEDMINEEDIQINNKNVLIFHTHTCESYTKTEENNYNDTGNFRTTDLNYSVSKVGDELQNQLKEYGFNVIHDTTYHDYPSYTGSYNRSLETVEEILKSNSDYEMIFDIHRDAIEDSSYAPTVKIENEYVSRIMFVIGTNGSGLDHPNWIENLRFAIKVQKKADEMYPRII